MPTAPATAALAYTRQHTLTRQVQCAGVGLHSGERVTVTLSPAGVDTGIRFTRSDTDRGAVIMADWRHVIDSQRATTIGDGGDLRIATVEHLMAALAACGIDNVHVEVDQQELPALDGSASPYVAAIVETGIEQQQAPRRALEILRPIALTDGDREVRLEPAPNLSIAFTLDFSNTAIGRQHLEIDAAEADLRTEICPARTFCLREEIETLHANGLGLGGNLDNTVVIDRDGVAEETTLRFPDELVRHKILDCLGDLYLLGRPLIGRFVGKRSGHALNHALITALMADPTAWREVEMGRNSV